MELCRRLAHFVTECVVLKGVREQFGVTREEVLEEILLFRGRTREKVERSIALLEEIWRRRRKWTDKCRDRHISSAGT